MKKIIALVMAAVMMLALSAFAVSAADFAPEVNQIYRANDLAGAEAGKNGFTFYAAEKGNYKPSELKNVTYKQGDWGSIIWENSELAQFGVSVQFWDNGIDAGFKFFPNRNQMVLSFTSPVEGNVTLGIEAGFEKGTGTPKTDVRLVRANGKLIGDKLTVTANAPENSGNYGRSDSNSKTSATIEVKKDETVYLYVEDTGDDGLFVTHLWMDITYNRLGADPDAGKGDSGKDNPGTGDILPVIFAVAAVSLAGIAVSKKHR